MNILEDQQPSKSEISCEIREFLIGCDGLYVTRASQSYDGLLIDLQTRLSCLWCKSWRLTLDTHVSKQWGTLETAKYPWRTIREKFPFSTFLKNSNNRVPTSSHSFPRPAEKSFWICQLNVHSPRFFNFQIFTVLICRTLSLLCLNQHTMYALVRQLLVRVPWKKFKEFLRPLSVLKVQGNQGLYRGRERNLWDRGGRYCYICAT